MLTGIIRYRKVEEVTTSKDEPTPIYLLGELVKASHASPEDAQHIVEHLMKKLDSKNPVVKAKALRACKYLVQNGAFDVQRILQRSPAPIRNLQNFKGPPDVLKGDALNERVRVSAKEAIEAIFSNETAPQAAAKTNSASSRYQGFGSQQSSGMISISHEQYRPAVATPQQQTTFLNNIPRVEMEVVQPRPQEPAKVSSVLGDEEEIVDNICQPGGVRLAPAKDDLRRFIDTVGTLNGTKIAVHLQKKLEGSSWQECYRALCVIEAVILQGSSVSCGEIGVHFQGDLGMIKKCASSVQSSVRDRANRILSIFTEVGEEPQTEVQETPSLLPESNDSVAAPMMDLLGDILPAQEEKSDIVSSPESLDMSVVDPKPVTETDMFSGMNIGQSQTPGKESNEHLAALLAPSPPSDPFPEASVPLQPESVPAQPSIVNPAPPQMQPTVFQMPVGYPPQPVQTTMPYFMQPVAPQQGVMYQQGPPRMDSRGEVPLAAFVGPAHTQKRNSAGKNAPAFGFIGDHMMELRGKK